MSAQARDAEVQQHYEQALQTLVGKVRQDPYVLAGVLLGSLAHDVVWEKSDIDLLLVTQEVRRKAGSLPLVEDGVNIHVVLQTRSEFRKTLEGSIQSSFMHSLLSKGRLLFCQDETLAELFEQRRHLGVRDRQIQLLVRGMGVLPAVAKAEKWLHVRSDPHYAFLWLMKAIDGLAAIEALLNGEIVEREVVQQALRHNPEFFSAIYTDLMDRPKTAESVGEALRAVDAYLRERAVAMFGPVLEYLAEAGGVRSTTELNHYFSNHMGIEGLDPAYEWLADVGVLAKIGTPVRVTDRSRVDLQEAAYFYEASEVEAAAPGGTGRRRPDAPAEVEAAAPGGAGLRRPDPPAEVEAAASGAAGRRRPDPPSEVEAAAQAAGAPHRADATSQGESAAGGAARRPQPDAPAAGGPPA